MPETLKDSHVYRFDQMAVQVKDKVEPSEADVDRYVGLEHIDPGSLTIRRWGEPGDVGSSKILFKAGDIIFGKRRAYQRKLAVADFDGICSAHAMVLRPKTDVVLGGFLPFFMQSDVFMDRAVKISVGGLSPTINWNDLAKEEFALPSLGAQREMVAAFAASRELSERLRALGDSAIAVLRSEQVNLFGSLSSAGIVRVGEAVIDSAFGPRFSSSLYSDTGSAAVVRTTDFTNDGSVDFATCPRVELPTAVVERHRLHIGDFLLSRSGEYAGMTRVFSGGSPQLSWIPAAYLIRFRLDQNMLDPEFLHEFCEGPSGARRVRALSQGSAVPNITGEAFRAMEIPSVTTVTQRQITAKLGALRSQVAMIERRHSDCGRLHGLLIEETVGRP